MFGSEITDDAPDRRRFGDDRLRDCEAHHSHLTSRTRRRPLAYNEWCDGSSRSDRAAITLQCCVPHATIMSCGAAPSAVTRSRVERRVPDVVSVVAERP